LIGLLATYSARKPVGQLGRSGVTVLAVTVLAVTVLAVTVLAVTVLTTT